MTFDSEDTLPSWQKSISDILKYGIIQRDTTISKLDFKTCSC